MVLDEMTQSVHMVDVYKNAEENEAAEAEAEAAEVMKLKLLK